MRIFRFDNSIIVPRKWLSRAQIKRYKSNTLGILHEPEEEGYFLKALDSLAESAAYINIGAAWGYYSLLAKKRRPEIDVFAVEAHPKMCSRIMEGSMINGVTGISVFNSAVVGKDGLDDGPMNIKFGYGASVRSVNSTDDADSMVVKLVDMASILESVPNSEILVTMDLVHFGARYSVEPPHSESVRTGIKILCLDFISSCLIAIKSIESCN